MNYISTFLDGRVFLNPTAVPIPGVPLREITPEMQSILDEAQSEGKRVRWESAEENNPSGPGRLVKVEPPLPSLRDRLKAKMTAQPAAVRAAFLPITSGVNYALDNDDVEAARAAIEAQAVPPELESAKAELLMEFDQ